MKQCPKCYKTYDDSWGKCLSCDVPLNASISVRQDELSVDSVNTLFDKEFKTSFLPPEGFYDNWAPTDERLNVMIREILKWLKIDDVPLPAQYAKGMKVPGLYVWQGQKSAILVNEKHRKDPFEVGAILAHECMHHYMKKKNLEISDIRKNELKTDLATICSGLGILIVNGMSHKSHWYLTVVAFLFGFAYVKEQRKSFGYFKANDYCSMFSRYLKLKNIDGSDVIGYIHPLARSFLPKDVSKKSAKTKSNLIMSHEKRFRRNLALQILVVVIGVCAAVAFYYAGYKENARDKQKITLEFQNMKKQIDDLAYVLGRTKDKMAQMKKDMEYYKTIGDMDNYKKTAITYEVFASEGQKNYKKYQFLIKNYDERAYQVRRRGY